MDFGGAEVGDNVLPALLQKLVGEFFFRFREGSLPGILAGILKDFFLDPQN